MQPDAVVGLTYTLNKNSSLIEWQQPEGGHGYDTSLVYRVDYFSQWDKVQCAVENCEVEHLLVWSYAEVISVSHILVVLRVL